MSDASFANALSLEQLHVFVEIAKAGSFSAAARSLRKAQGSISYHVSGLEQQLGVVLFDRNQRPPALTAAGRAVLRLAHQVTSDLDQLRHVAWQLGEGLEPQVRLAVDVLFPPKRLAAVLAEFGSQFADVDLIVSSGIVDFAAKQVLAGHAELGIASPVNLGRELVRAPCAKIELVPVVAPCHPLASWPGPVPDRELNRHVHLLLSSAPSHKSGPATGFASPRRWHLGDPETRHVLIRAGLGWARLPRFTVEEDLAENRLAKFDAEHFGQRKMVVPLSVVHRRNALLGKASRWLFDRLTAPDGET